MVVHQQLRCKWGVSPLLIHTSRCFVLIGRPHPGPSVVFDILRGEIVLLPCSPEKNHYYWSSVHHHLVYFKMCVCMCVCLMCMPEKLTTFQTQRPFLGRAEERITLCSMLPRRMCIKKNELCDQVRWQPGRSAEPICRCWSITTDVMCSPHPASLDVDQEYPLFTFCITATRWMAANRVPFTGAKIFETKAKASRRKIEVSCRHPPTSCFPASIFHTTLIYTFSYCEFKIHGT